MVPWYGGMTAIAGAMVGASSTQTILYSWPYVTGDRGYYDRPTFTHYADPPRGDHASAYYWGAAARRLARELGLGIDAFRKAAATVRGFPAPALRALPARFWLTRTPTPGAPRKRPRARLSARAAVPSRTRRRLRTWER